MAYINHDVSTMAMPSGMNRMGQFPLDMSSVYYDKASLETYATSGAIAYVGQIVSLVDADQGTVTVYSIQNTAGDLKEVGTKPVGDENTIVIAEDGTISLAGIEDLVFEKDVEGEDGEVTKETVQYQALLTKDGLVWVEPSKTTVEGLATLIDALTKRVDDAEDAIEALEGRIKTLEEEEDKNTITTVAATDASVTVGGEGYDYTVAVNISAEEGNSLSLKADGLFVEVPEYAVRKEEREGYHGVYHLTKDGTDVDVEIAVPVTDLSEYAKTADVEDLVAEEIGKKVHFRTEIVETVPTVENAEVGVLYLVADENAESGTYIEYMLVGEGETLAVEKIGSTATDLSGYALKSELPTEEDFGVLSVSGKDAIAVTEGQNPEVSLKLDETATNVILTQGENGLKADLANEIAVRKITVDDKIVIDGDKVNFIDANNVNGASASYGVDGIAITESGKGIFLDKTKLELNNDSAGKQVKISADEILIGDGSVGGNYGTLTAANMSDILLHVHEVDNVATLQLGETVITETELAQLNAALATVDKLTEHEEYAEETYAKKADVYTKDEIDEIIGVPGVPAEKDEDGEVVTPAKAGTGVYQHVYSKSEVTDLIADITGGESAADVKADLTAYKTTNDARVDAVEAKLSGVEAGADVSTIKVVKVNGEALTPDESKAVDITVPTSITTMGGYSELNEKVAKNANDIVTLTNGLGTTNINVSGLTTRIAALEAEVGEVAESRIDALEGVTAQHTIDIGANTAAITTINTDTLPALQQAIANEKTAREAAIGKPSEGDTPATGVYAAIEAVESTIDFSPYAKKTEVASTYATIAALQNIYRVTGEGEEAKVEGVLADEIARATAAEAKIAGDVAALDATLKAAIENEGEGLDSIKELALWIEDHETDILPILAGFGGEGQPAAIKPYIDEQIAAIPQYTLPVATLAALGGVKSSEADNKVKVAEDGTMEVNMLTTDKIKNGVEEFILNGGSASLN